MGTDFFVGTTASFGFLGLLESQTIELYFSKGTVKIQVLPILSLISAEKKVDGCKLQSVEKHVEARVNFWLNSVPSPRPPAAAKRTPVVTPLAPIPPGVPQTKRRVTRSGMFLRPAKAVSGTSEFFCTHLES